MFKLIVAALCLAVAFEECGALKCFVCNSERDGSCSDHFEEDSPALRQHFLVDCQDTVDELTGATLPAYCKKVTMWLSEPIDERGNVESETRVDRACANKRRDTGEKSCYQSRADDHVVATCACDKDACNTGATVQLSLLASLPALAAAVFARA